MKQFKLFILIVILAIAHQSYGQVTDPKQQQLINLSTRNSPIIDLNETGYRHFVQNPTNYDIAVFYTTGNCDFCDKIFEEFTKTFYSYNSENAMTEYADNQRPVFFARLIFTQATQQFFFDLGYQTVPSIAVFDHQMNAKVSEKDKKHYQTRRSWKISPMEGHITVNKVIDFINQKTNRKIEYKEPLINVLTTIAMILTSIGIVLKIFFTFMPFFLRPKVQFQISVVIYAVCMSGVVYNIIHNTPWTTTDAQGVVHWMADGQGGREQMGAEGVIMSCSISMAGVLIVLMQYFCKHQTLSGTSRVILSILCIVVSYLLTQFIEGIYRKKSWYEIRFYPPVHYIKGPVKRDQGFTF